MRNIIIGAERSGVSLLGAILRCHKDLDVELSLITYDRYQEYGISILDRLNAKKSECHYIWITRNPISSVCSYYENAGLSYEEGFQYWFDVNMLLWYFFASGSDNYQIQYEDLLIRTNKIRQLFQFLGAPFSTQYLKYGDFDQPKSQNKRFQQGEIDIERVDPYPKNSKLKDLWTKYKNEQLINFLLYQFLDD